MCCILDLLVIHIQCEGLILYYVSSYTPPFHVKYFFFNRNNVIIELGDISLSYKNNHNIQNK